MGPLADKETGAFITSAYESMDAMLLGRVTFDIWVAYWPLHHGDDPISHGINTVPKYVPSTTLKDPTWQNTHVIDGDVEAAVRELKQQPGRDLLLQGSGKLLRWQRSSLPLPWSRRSRPGCCLELADSRLDVAIDDVGVLPRRVLQRRRRHVLGHGVDPVGDRIVAVVERPVLVPDVEGHPAEQHRIHALVGRGDERAGLLVGERPHPPAAIEPVSAVLVWPSPTLVHAVQGHEDHCGQLHVTAPSRR